MASVEANKIPDEQSFMGEYWNFRKKFYQPEESNAYWEALLDESEGICQKYISTDVSDYVNQIIIVCLSDIEERWKKQTGSKYVCEDVLTRAYNRLKRN